MAPEVYRAKSKTQKSGSARKTSAPSGGNSRRTGQTPGRSDGRSGRKPLTLEEKRRRQRKQREELRRRQEERARRKQIQKQRRKRLFTLCFWVAVVLVILYWSVVALLIVNRPDGSEDALPLLLFEQGERKAKKEYKPEEVCIGGTKYLPVTFLEDFIAISQFGDQKTRSFLICSSGEFATFYVNNEEVIVNGERVSMRAPALMIDEKLYLPLDFYAEKMTCFELGKNNATYGADVLTFLKDREPSFVFHPVTADLPVDYATVPVAPTLPSTDPQT